MQVQRIVIFCVLACGLSACGGSRGTGVSAPPTRLLSSPEVAGPLFSLASGTYDSAENVTISSTPRTTVYYTTDGCTPTTSSRVYNGPLPVTAPIELRAIAIVDDNSSSVSTAAYIINSGDASLSGLPIPPGSGVPRPEGGTGRLRVLDWAGFKAVITYTFGDSLQSQISAYPQLQATTAHIMQKYGVGTCGPLLHLLATRDTIL